MWFGAEPDYGWDFPVVVAKYSSMYRTLPKYVETTQNTVDSPPKCTWSGQAAHRGSAAKCVEHGDYIQDGDAQKQSKINSAYI